MSNEPKNLPAKVEKPRLPSIQELYDDSAVVALEKDNDLNILLNQQPPAQWIKKHKLTNKEYLPVGRVEYLLTKLFVRWRSEIRGEPKLIGNSVVIVVRLHYQRIVDGEWDWVDGVGAAPLQTDSGAGACEFDKLKDNAVQLAAPSAESYAFKDAASKLGRIFGRDLTRSEFVDYNMLNGTFENEKKRLDDMAMKIIKGLDKYKGEDKAELKKLCMDKRAAGEFTEEFANNIAKQIGVVL